MDTPHHRDLQSRDYVFPRPAQSGEGGGVEERETVRRYATRSWGILKIGHVCQRKVYYISLHQPSNSCMAHIPISSSSYGCLSCAATRLFITLYLRDLRPPLLKTAAVCTALQGQTRREMKAGRKPLRM